MLKGKFLKFDWLYYTANIFPSVLVRYQMTISWSWLNIIYLHVLALVTGKTIVILILDSPSGNFMDSAAPICSLGVNCSV